ncbi:DUF3857 domain-containing protein [Aurantiacibacter sediminis]|uniref:DUF3857 domain-containing protein n=1 Tax=Aurantiacibacter sediminis TaxID=2793064 RepID=A0ABS0N2Y6_9SPHN|nr:DUF3857 domain-containing protein [Aurantiacibacter sediminis]MBH5322326.1 DUF3857 domain-containing protein [Aurantiacibacter sediminis]
MRLPTAAVSLTAILLSSTAQAGEEPLYSATPDWVEEADFVGLVADESVPAELLRDWQYRIEDGVVLAYHDFAIRVDNPQALMSQNTQTLTWLPDKGDLTIHRFEIYREGELIDLVEQGVTFDVLRRERGLEQRLLDGQLTASVSVPGLREGDVLRISHTVSTDDQALGEEVQATQFLRSEPWQVGFARTVMSWPSDEDMYWRAEDRVELSQPVERDGYNYLTVDLPLEEADPMPQDAPYRFRRPPVLRVGSFESWLELSAVMYPHFEDAAALPEGSPIRERAQEIMAQTSDPRARAALATQLVQDDISYLLNGLDGGNYLPQSAAETWENRYGDCKAKSVLLLSLLREMGIESEVVLVSTRQGDAVPELLPLPAAFDHMIVHAIIDGTDYWLDGTSAATRLANLADVPPFYHALPLRDGGAQLMPMVQRDLAVPQMAMSMDFDHSRGVDFPALFTMEMTMSGPMAAGLESVVDANDPEALRSMATSFGGSEGLQVSNLSVAYDSENAVGTVVIEGIAQTSFSWTDGRLRFSDEMMEDDLTFNPDRARPEWRDIPVATEGPGRVQISFAMTLPEDGEGYELENGGSYEWDNANSRLVNYIGIENGRMIGTSDIFMTLGEVAAADLPEARRTARRFAASTPEVTPPQDVTWRWELSSDERAALAAPILEAYEAAISFADEDDQGPRYARAAFLRNVYDYEAALADYDVLIEEEPSAWVYAQRALLHRRVGDIDAAIADQREAYELNPSAANARTLADLLTYHGDAEEALELLRYTPVAEDDRVYHDDDLGTAMAIAGDVDGGSALIEEMVADFPQNSTALNGDCWFRGLFATQLDTALARCTQAVERAANPSNAIDSRALIHFRLGDFEQALADLDQALAMSPAQAASHYLRGIVRLHAGDEGGREDLETGLLMAPELETIYSFHGIAPPQ